LLLYGTDSNILILFVEVEKDQLD